MKLKRIHFSVVILATVLPFCFLSCGSNGSSSSDDSVALDEASVISEEESAESLIKKTVEQWNSSLNNRDLRKSNAVYADKVHFYTQEISGEKASELRIEMATKDPTWLQSIVTDIEITDLGDGLMEAAFTKRSNSQKGTHTYPAYLYLRKINGDWLIVKESDKVTDTNVANRKKKIPSDAIRGDFDGDGTIDHVWIEGKFDEDGYAIGELRLASDRENLKGLTWGSSRGVLLINVGDLNGSNRDFLGCIPLYDSTWTSYELYAFRNGRWNSMLKPFGVWLGDEDTNRVWKSDRKGYVEIKCHDMSGDPDDMFDPVYKTVKLNW